jgi:hypothetical protein
MARGCCAPAAWGAPEWGADGKPDRPPTPYEMRVFKVGGPAGRRWARAAAAWVQQLPARPRRPLARRRPQPRPPPSPPPPPNGPPPPPAVRRHPQGPRVDVRRPGKGAVAAVKRARRRPGDAAQPVCAARAVPPRRGRGPAARGLRRLVGARPCAGCLSCLVLPGSRVAVCPARRLSRPNPLHQRPAPTWLGGRAAPSFPHTHPAGAGPRDGERETQAPAAGRGGRRRRGRRRQRRVRGAGGGARQARGRQVAAGAVAAAAAVALRRRRRRRCCGVRGTGRHVRSRRVAIMRPRVRAASMQGARKHLG